MKIESLTEQLEKFKKLNCNSKRKFADDESGLFFNQKRFLFEDGNHQHSDSKMDYIIGESKIFEETFIPKIVGVYNSNGKANGRMVYEGPRGGYFYLIPHNGQKSYVSQLRNIRFL